LLPSSPHSGAQALIFNADNLMFGRRGEHARACLWRPVYQLTAAQTTTTTSTAPGVFFGSITTDMTKEVIEAYELFEGVQTFSTLWEWSERFVRNGFRIATADVKVLQHAWKIEVEANEGDFAWYPDMESMRYCFYVKPDAPPVCTENQQSHSMWRGAGLSLGPLAITSSARRPSAR
jgi:hypothetical protein